VCNSRRPSLQTPPRFHEGLNAKLRTGAGWAADRCVWRNAVNVGDESAAETPEVGEPGLVKIDICSPWQMWPRPSQEAANMPGGEQLHRGLNAEALNCCRARRARARTVSSKAVACKYRSKVMKRFVNPQYNRQIAMMYFLITLSARFQSVQRFSFSPVPRQCRGG